MRGSHLDKTEQFAAGDKTVHELVESHVERDRRSTALEKRLDLFRSILSSPRFITVIAAAVIAWIAINAGLAVGLGSASSVDPPPFFWLQGVVSLLALCTTVLILTTQRRDDEIADRREKLTLELAILSEKKTAKIIELLEALRQDHPEISDRHDHQAGEMAKPTDPQQVLEQMADKKRA